VNYLSTLRKFLKRNVIVLEDEFWEDLRGRGKARAVT